MQYPSMVPAERHADAMVHVLGVLIAVVAGTALLVSAYHAGNIFFALACALYVVTILSSKVCSALYHLIANDALRPYFRRLDHAAIYVLIAGTFTPLLAYVGTSWSLVILACVWAFAIPATLSKLLLGTLDSKWSLASYLGLGWFGVPALPSLWGSLPDEALICAVSGGLIYSAGTFFYARKKQAYRYAIWHGFVLAGTSAFLFAVYLTSLAVSGT